VSAIVFGSLPEAPRARTIGVPDTRTSRDELFSLLAGRIDFPSYFGRNWDALLDMLSDLTWLTDDEVRIVHSAVPIALGKDWDTYLAVVTDAVARRNAAIDDGFEDHPRLLVALPESELARVLGRPPPGDSTGH
jgi:RNAse (barnase) inhibitor barstar